MSDSTMLLDLQRRQHEHDKGFHQDIFNTSYPDRMNHYVLHFSKYVGRLAKSYTDESDQRHQIEKTLADSVIVSLAAANTLNLDLRDELEKEFDIKSNGVLSISSELNQSSHSMSLDEVQDWLFTQMAVPTGEMSNAMESLDHMEPMNVRQVLEDKTVEIVSLLLIASDELETSLVDLLDDRWIEIEDESIL